MIAPPSSTFLLLLIGLLLLIADANAIQTLPPRRMIASRRYSITLNISSLDPCMSHFFLGRTGGHNEHSAILEVRHIAHLGPLAQCDGSIVLLRDDDVLERAVQFAGKLHSSILT